MAGGCALGLHHLCGLRSSFISTWVSMFGVPALLTSYLPVHILHLVGALFHPGYFEDSDYSFHPQSNGMIERFHRSLKSSLRARLAGSDWLSHLPLVMLGLRSSPKDDSGFSPAEAVYSSPLSLPGEFLEHTEFPPDVFLRLVDQAASGFSGPP